MQKEAVEEKSRGVETSKVLQEEKGEWRRKGLTGKERESCQEMPVERMKKWK